MKKIEFYCGICQTFKKGTVVSDETGRIFRIVVVVCESCKDIATCYFSRDKLL